MGKRERHLKIKEIITNYAIKTQEELVEHLRKSGFAVTQATVSRDIKDLQLVKVLTKNGTYQYSLPVEKNYNPVSQLEKVLSDTLVKMDTAENLIVLKTIPGNAQAVGALIDQLDWEEIVGTICGDDTCLIISRSEEKAKKIFSRFSERHIKIKEIIAMHEITTQEELAEHLKNQGIEVTQATLSRDMKNLQIIKVPTDDGKYKYSLSREKKYDATRQLQQLLTDVFIHLDQAGHLLVIKTIPGNAHALGVVIDQLDWEEIVGTVCGDDTCLIVARTHHDAEKITSRLHELMSSS